MLLKMSHPRATKMMAPPITNLRRPPAIMLEIRDSETDVGSLMYAPLIAARLQYTDEERPCQTMSRDRARRSVAPLDPRLGYGMAECGLHISAWRPLVMWREQSAKRREMVARITLDRYGLWSREGGRCQAREEQRFRWSCVSHTGPVLVIIAS